MAQLQIYKCEKCGYEVESNRAGFDGLVSGLILNFRCDHCKEIVTVNAKALQGAFWVDCPNCGQRVTSNWNPVDGSCPKCDGRMEAVRGFSIMAD